MKEELSYQQRYYAEHRDELLEQRRQRYAENARYRAKAIKRARVQKRERKKAAKQNGRVRRRAILKPVQMTLRGKPQIGYHFHDLIAALGISKYRVRQWRWHGYLPAPVMFSPITGYGLYTREQLEALIVAARQTGLRSDERAEHGQLAKFQAAWTKILRGKR